MYRRLDVLLDTTPLETLQQAIRITGAKPGMATETFVRYMAVKQAKYFHGVLRNMRTQASQDSYEI